MKKIIGFILLTICIISLNEIVERKNKKVNNSTSFRMERLSFVKKIANIYDPIPFNYALTVIYPKPITSNVFDVVTTEFDSMEGCQNALILYKKIPYLKGLVFNDKCEKVSIN